MKTYMASIMLHPGILDNAGMAVTTALKGLGFKTVEKVRIGKTLTFNAENFEEAEEIIKTQVNEVMEFYNIKEI